MPHIFASVSGSSPNEGMPTENGCVFAVHSPGTSVCGTGRCSTSVNGLPVRRSSRNSSPRLLGATSAGTSCRLRREDRRASAASPHRNPRDRDGRFDTTNARDLYRLRARRRSSHISRTPACVLRRSSRASHCRSEHRRALDSHLRCRLVFASTANSRASAVAVRMRRAHSPLAPGVS